MSLAEYWIINLTGVRTILSHVDSSGRMKSTFLLWVMVVLLLLVGTARFFSVLVADDIQPIHDQLSLHVLTNLLYTGLFEADPAIDKYLQKEQSNLYPPIIHFFALPFVAVFGKTKGPETSLIIYAWLMLLSVFGIGRKLIGNGAGLLAMIFIILTPGLDGF